MLQNFAIVKFQDVNQHVMRKNHSSHNLQSYYLHNKGKLKDTSRCLLIKIWDLWSLLSSLSVLFFHLVLIVIIIPITIKLWNNFQVNHAIFILLQLCNGSEWWGAAAAKKLREITKYFRTSFSYFWLKLASDCDIIYWLIYINLCAISQSVTRLPSV